MRHKIRYGSLSKQLASLAFPIFIETFLVMMLGAVDTFMLSRHSDSSVAAVGLVNQLLNLIFIIFEVISWEHPYCAPSTLVPANGTK